MGHKFRFIHNSHRIPIMASEGLKLAQKIAQKMIGGPGFNRLLSKLEMVSAGNGKCTAELLLGPEHQNNHGTLHGGLTATLVDAVSTFAMISRGEGKTGVSVDINVQYMNPAREGDVIVIDATTMKAGKRLVFLEINISNKANGNMIAKGTHTMYTF